VRDGNKDARSSFLLLEVLQVHGVVVVVISLVVKMCGISIVMSL
jgi:hypothetical protein